MTVSEILKVVSTNFNIFEYLTQLHAVDNVTGIFNRYAWIYPTLNLDVDNVFIRLLFEKYFLKRKKNNSTFILDRDRLL